MTTKPETQQSCFDLAVELTRGPAFFDDRGHPTDAVMRYTGGRVTKDDERCLVAGALRLLSCSDREIARVVGCDVRSIPLMLAEAEKGGRIPALKERLAKLTGTNAERCQIVLADLLDRAGTTGGSIEMAAMIKAVSTAGGINTQNLQLLTGGATEIVEVRVAAGRAEIEAWAKEVGVDMAIDAEVIQTPSECQSAETRTEPLQIERGEPRDARSDTSNRTPERVPEMVKAGRGGVQAGIDGHSSDRLTGSKIIGEVAL